MIWSLNLASNPLPVGVNSGISWQHPGPGGTNSIQIDVDASSNRFITAPIKLDLRPFRGMNLRLESLIKANGVTRPAASGNGVKCMLVYVSAKDGERNINVGTVSGTFDWTAFQSERFTISEDAGDAYLYIGLQDSKGQAWVRNVQLTLWRPAIDPAAAPMVRGHVPLRGMMSPGNNWSSNAGGIKDFDDLKSWRVNLLRWQLGPGDAEARAMSSAEYAAWIDRRLPELDAALSLAQARGIKMVIALMSMPGGRAADMSNRMYGDDSLKATFYATWQKLAARYKNHPAVFAYDLWNEPVRGSVWRAGMQTEIDIQEHAAKLIRAIDPLTTIAVQYSEELPWGAIEMLTPMKISNAIYEFHMYTPHAFTHQQVGENNPDAISYNATMPGGTPLNKAYVRSYLQRIRDFQLAFRVPVYIGEFSAVRWADGAAQYLTDCTSIFEEFGWDWTYHAYREYDGWSLEIQNLPKSPVTKATVETDRATAIRYWLNQNLSP